MTRQTSTKRSASQSDSTIRSDIAARFREERIRLEPIQSRFATLIGLTQGKLSHLELGVREIRADVLAAAAAEGADVRYILTGERSADALDPETSEFLSDYLAMREQLQGLARSFIRTMRESDDGTWVLRDHAQTPFRVTKGNGNGNGNGQ